MSEHGKRRFWHAHGAVGSAPALAASAVLLFGALTGCAALDEEPEMPEKRPTMAPSEMEPQPEHDSEGTSAAVDPMANDSLQRAIADNDADAVRAALAAGADLELRGADGRTPLVAATKANAADAAIALIEAGADVNAQDDLHDSAYLYAGAESLVPILVATLANGADLTSTNRYGGTALIPAGEHGHVEVTKLLLDAGIDPDHVNNLGWTALQEAVLLGSDGPEHRETVRLLLAGGADPNLRDFEGNTPLANALARGYTGLADLILAAGGTR